MIKGLILDIDQTLVDSTSASAARKRRAWSEVYSLIPGFKVYDGVREMIQLCRESGIRICIVSTAPRPYVQRVIAAHEIHADYIVGYHDAYPVKPHPAPMLKALELMGLKHHEVISFGDRFVDESSSRSAGIAFVACLWGSAEFNVNTTMKSGTMRLCNSVELPAFIQQILS